jgi:hypothetical protein
MRERDELTEWALRVAEVYETWARDVAEALLPLADELREQGIFEEFDQKCYEADLTAPEGQEEEEVFI